MILHLTRKEKFTKPFIEFTRKHFDIKEHFFLLVGGQQNKEFAIEEDKQIKVIKNKNDFIKYVINFNIKMYKADKIIIHGFSQPYCYYYLFSNPWLLKKTYWVIWGADLYGYLEKKISYKEKILEFMKSFCIKRFKGFITEVEGDYKLAKKYYLAQGKYYDCFAYPSNLYKDIDILINKKNINKIYIQVGNSASEENNHKEILDKLVRFKDENIEIICPLSYGNSDYGKEIETYGKHLFGDKFIALTEFLIFSEYLDILAKIDIAFFNHNRQQAVGNIWTLIGLGKKIYIKNNITTWDTITKKGVKVFNIEDEIILTKLDDNVKKENITLVKKYFSLLKLVEEWKVVFNA